MCNIDMRSPEAEDDKVLDTCGDCGKDLVAGDIATVLLCELVVCEDCMQDAFCEIAVLDDDKTIDYELTPTLTPETCCAICQQGIANLWEQKDTLGKHIEGFYFIAGQHYCEDCVKDCTGELTSENSIDGECLEDYEPVDDAWSWKDERYADESICGEGESRW